MFTIIKMMIQGYVSDLLRKRFSGYFAKAVSKMKSILEVMKGKYKIGPKTLGTIIFGIVFFVTMPLPIINQVIALAGISAIVLIYEVMLSS